MSCVPHSLSFQTGSGLQLTGVLPYSTGVTVIAKVTVRLVSGFYNHSSVWMVCFSFLLLSISNQLRLYFFPLQYFFHLGDLCNDKNQREGSLNEEKALLSGIQRAVECLAFSLVILHMVCSYLEWLSESGLAPPSTTESPHI